MRDYNQCTSRLNHERYIYFKRVEGLVFNIPGLASFFFRRKASFINLRRNVGTCSELPIRLTFFCFVPKSGKQMLVISIERHLRWEATLVRTVE